MKSGWLDVPFDDAVADESAGNLKTPQSEFLHSGLYPIVDQGKELISGYTNDETRLWKGELPAVIFGDHTRCFKFVDFPFCMGADGVKVLRPKKNVDVKYLFQYLRQLRLTDGGYDRHFKYLKRCRIVVPPIPEQRRIAEILDKADALRTKRRSALAQLDTLAQSIFLDLFGDPGTNPKNWPVLPLCEIGVVITGNTPSRENPEYFGTAIEWIKSDNINTPSYYVTKADEGLSEQGKAVGRIAPPNSILVTCIAGSPECIGNAGMTDREVAFNQQINALVPRRGNPHFIYAQLLVGKRLIQNASTNSMKGMVSKSRFEQIRLMFPPLDLQSQFADRLAALERLKERSLASLRELNDLFNSLQHRAFRGEL